jgi:DNA-binding ferritin-like protein
MEDFDFAGSYGLKLKRKISTVGMSSENDSCAMAVANLSAELLNAQTSFHKLHLKVKNDGSFAAHMALKDLYEAIPDHVDSLVEAYQGATLELVDLCDCDAEYKMVYSVDEAITYLQELKSKVTTLQSIMSYSEIVNDLDTLKSTFNTALYKLKFLK